MRFWNWRRNHPKRRSWNELREAMRDAVYHDDIPRVIQLAQEDAPLDGWFYSNDPDIPIVCAASDGSLPMVRTLAELGANVNGRGMEGETALMSAAFNGHTEVVQFLLEQGADATAKSRSGETVLETAMRGRFPSKKGAIVALIRANIEANK